MVFSTADISAASRLPPSFSLNRPVLLQCLLEIFADLLRLRRAGTAGEILFKLVLHGQGEMAAGVGQQVAGLNGFGQIGIAFDGFLQAARGFGVAAGVVEHFAQQEQRVAPFLAGGREVIAVQIRQQHLFGLGQCRPFPERLAPPEAGRGRRPRRGGKARCTPSAYPRRHRTRPAKATTRPGSPTPADAGAALRSSNTREAGSPRGGNRALANTPWRRSRSDRNTAAYSRTSWPRRRSAGRRGGIARAPTAASARVCFGRPVSALLDEILPPLDVQIGLHEPQFVRRGGAVSSSRRAAGRFRTAAWPRYC